MRESPCAVKKLQIILVLGEKSRAGGMFIKHLTKKIL